MCIFAKPVVSVSETRIFARPSGAGTQFLAYQMSYQSTDENAMILPLPVRRSAGEQGVRFIDLQVYEEFFDDLEKGFPYLSPMISVGCSKAPAGNDMLAMGLTVFEVGNYVASFVPTIEDFSRLDPQFTLPKTTWDLVPEYSDYGFAVFQLANGASRPHPMAFEFETDSKSIYFPTLHIHDGQVHESEEFDHTLYMQHAGLDDAASGYVNYNVPDRNTGVVRSQNNAKDFCDTVKANGLLVGGLLVHKQIIRGVQANQDTQVLATGDPLKRSFNLRAWFKYAPWLLAAAWFFRRRNNVAKLQDSKNTESEN